MLNIIMIKSRRTR